MGVFDLYSRRKKNANQGALLEVYQYDKIPERVRVQVIGIWRDAIGPYSMYGTPPNANKWWKFIHDTLAREKGVFELSREGKTPLEKCGNYLLRAESIEDCIDIIEFTFKL